MARLYYSTNAQEASLVAGINNVATTLQVDTITGYPVQFPFSVICEQGTSNEEMMLVTNVAGTTFTVTRGYDSTTAVSHSTGAKIVHGVGGAPFNEASEHVNASSNVHGLSGGASVVGTTQSQTLTNKTLTAPTINNGTANSTTLVTPTIASFTNAQHTHTDAASGGAIGLSFIGAASNSASSSGTVNTSYQDIPSMSLTFTAPAAWQTGASKLALHLEMALTVTAGTLQIGWVVDGVVAGEELFIDSSSTAKHHAGVIPLPSVGGSHTIKARFRITSGSGSFSYLGSQFWASVV